jgi:hypothetical protein
MWRQARLALTYYWTTSFDPVVSATITGIVNSEVFVQVRGDIPYTETKICCSAWRRSSAGSQRAAPPYMSIAHDVFY